MTFSRVIRASGTCPVPLTLAEKCGEIREVVYRLDLEPLLKQMSHSVVFVIVIIYIG